MKTAYILAICAAMTAVSTSCDHKDLCENHSHTGRLNVVFDWTNAPDANPESMSLYLYPKDGGVAQRYEFANKNGGSIEIPSGEYIAVCINSDTRNLVLSQTDNTTYNGNDSYKYFKLSTDDAQLAQDLSSISKSVAAEAPRARDTEDERVAYTPEAFWTDTNTNVVVKSLSVDVSQTITLYPSAGYCTYTVQLKNIANVARVREMSASLSGMAGGLYVAQRLASDDVVTFPFAVAVDNTNAAASGTFNTFGHCPSGSSHQHSVVIYAVLTDGNVYYQTVDVTDQVHNASNQSNVVITIDGVNLPEEGGTTGSGNINVEAWEVWHMDVKM